MSKAYFVDVLVTLEISANTESRAEVAAMNYMSSLPKNGPIYDYSVSDVAERNDYDEDEEDDEYDLDEENLEGLES